MQPSSAFCSHVQVRKTPHSCHLVVEHFYHNMVTDMSSSAYLHMHFKSCCLAVGHPVLAYPLVAVLCTFGARHTCCFIRNAYGPVTP